MGLTPATSRSSTLSFSGAEVRLTATQAVAAGGAVVTWPSATFDTDAYFAAGTPTRLTAPFAGAYLVTFALGRTVQGEFAGYFQINGAAPRYGYDYEFVDGIGCSAAAIVSMTLGQYIEVTSYSSAGHTLDNTNGVTRAQIVYLGAIPT